MEHAIQLPKLTIGSFISHPKYLDPIDPPRIPFCSPKWCLQQKPRFISLIDVYKDHELLTTYQVDQKSIYLIGRNSGVCDIMLEHCSVSRLHASIIHHHEGCTYLVDLGSYHGTKVDEMPLQALRPTLIVNGSVLKFGMSSRAYFFKTFESREQITEIVHSRIGLDQDEKELQKNTWLNRAISYRLGLSPIQPEPARRSSGSGSDEPMPDAPVICSTRIEEDATVEETKEDEECELPMAPSDDGDGNGTCGVSHCRAMGRPVSILCLNRKRARPSSATSFSGELALMNGTSMPVDFSSSDINSSLISSDLMPDSLRSLEPKRVHFSEVPPDIILQVVSPVPMPSENGMIGENQNVSTAVPMVLDNDSDGRGPSDMNTSSDDDHIAIQPTSPFESSLSIQPTTPFGRNKAMT